MKYAYYPGCSVETSARMYEASLRRVLKRLDVELEEIEDWNCCGASSAHSMDPAVATGLAARNLGLAEKTGLERTHLYRKLKQLGVDLARNKRGGL